MAKRSWLTRHWRSKLFALVLATAAWFIMVGKNTEMLRDVRANLQVKHPSGIVALPETQMFLADFRGPTAQLERIGEQIDAVINLEGKLDPASFTDQLTRQSITVKIAQEHFGLSLPAEVAFRGARPDKIDIVCERLVQRSVPIRPSFFYTAEDGTKQPLQFGQPTRGVVARGHRINWDVTFCNPLAVIVSGPETVVNKLKYVETQPIDITGLSSGYDPPLSLVSDIPDPDLGRVAISIPDSFYQLHIEVEIERMEMELKSVPINLLRPPVFPFIVSVHSTQTGDAIESVDLKIVGPSSEVENLTPTDPKVVATVDLRDLFVPGQGNLPPRQSEVPLTIILPDRVELQQDEQHNVLVTISPIAPSKEPVVP